MDVFESIFKNHLEIGKSCCIFVLRSLVIATEHKGKRATEAFMFFYHFVHYCTYNCR